jgi:hypothetical protein
MAPPTGLIALSEYSRKQVCRTSIEGKIVEIVDSEAMQWHMPKAGHREEGVEFKPLFTGEEGAANNYWFTLVQVRESYKTPAHQHMFDQVRFMIKGGFNFGPQEQVEGTVGYFTEGTTYEQNGEGYSFHLLLQCEGGSRTRYFSGRSMRGATDALRETGAFAGGRYRYSDGREVDGYEAIYHHLTGEMPNYTAPRYERPIIIEPNSFGWSADPQQPGARWKHLGVFNERQLGLKMLQLDAGASLTLAASSAGLLAYVVSGEGDADGQSWSTGCGLRLAADEPATFAATSAAAFFIIDLPKP